MTSVYLFTSKSMGLPSAVFTSYELASTWIKNNYLSGILTEYPLDQSCYDWAIEGGYFKEKSAIDRAPTFIEKFVSAYQQNWHFEHGEELCNQNMRNSA
ncbi:hypothetical protein A6M14_02530 [Acinetobacter sp. Ac_877]|uniref:DUF7710 domain-containing protein n=1 Tax=Acinetobacter portensis TaxID=1839785 RepID=UPI00128B134D|nr:hypothetical protein [Acinetobacter portensis]MPW42749.1 hypothetical protein [Acinetobacter portensis]